MNKPSLNQIKKLLQHCDGLTTDNNKYTKVYNSYNNDDIIDKKTWVFCTKYAELLIKANEQLIEDFLHKYRKINNIKISDVDFDYYKQGDRGDLYYEYNNIQYVIHVKSCPENMYNAVKNKLKKNNKTNFMAIAAIIIRKDILPLKYKLKDLYISNINEFVNYVINDIYSNISIKISDVQFINCIDIS